MALSDYAEKTKQTYKFLYTFPQILCLQGEKLSAGMAYNNKMNVQRIILNLYHSSSLYWGKK